MITAAGICLFLFLLLIIGITVIGYSHAPADPNALHHPLAERFVAGKRVRVQLILVGSVNPPTGAIEQSITCFRKHLAGEFDRMSDVKVPETVLTWPVGKTETFDVLFGHSLDLGPSDIAIAICPEINDFPYNGFSLRRTDGSQLILIDAKKVDGKHNETKTALRRIASVVLSREDRWELLVKHELMHALGVPGDAGRRWEGGHCTSPACILYKQIDLRSACRAIVNFAQPSDLCGQCQAEIQGAQQTARGQFPEGVEGWDRLTELNKIVRLNLNRGLAYSLRGEEYYNHGALDDALRDQNRAIELSPELGRSYAERAYTYGRKGDVVRSARDFLSCVKAGDDASAARISQRNLTRLVAATLRDPARETERSDILDVTRELCQILDVTPDVPEAIATAMRTGEGLDAAIMAFGQATGVAGSRHDANGK